MQRRVGATALRVFWWAVLVAFGLISVAIIGPSYLNHDDAWYLYMGRVLLHGGTIYRDVIDTNPPLIVYMTLPAVWVAERLDLSAVVIFKIWVYVLALLSLLYSARLIRATDGVPFEARQFLLAVLVFVTLPFARAIEFGQREHLMVLATIPYILAAVGWASGHPLRGRAAWLVGAVAGLGFAMKPHYLLGWLAIEVSLALAPSQRSWRRAEALASTAAIALYGLSVVIFVPQYLSLADKVRQVYVVTNSPASLLLQLVDLRLWAVGLVLVVLLRLPRGTRSGTLVLFAAWTGFLLGAMLQLKGWNYHLYPARAVSLLFFAATGSAVFQALPAIGTMVRGGLRAVGAGAVGVLLLWGGRFVVESGVPGDADLVTRLIGIVQKEAPRGTIAALGMRAVIYPAFPTVNYTGIDWSLRHNSLWFLPGFYKEALQAPDPIVRFRSPERMSPLERGFYEEIVGDLCAKPPDLLLIEAPQPKAPMGRRALDLAAYYGQDARYRRLSAAYVPLTTLGPFVVYKRGGPASCHGQPDGAPDVSTR